MKIVTENVTFTIKFEIVLLHVLLIGIYTYDILAYSNDQMFKVSHILPANITQMVTSGKRHYWYQIESENRSNVNMSVKRSKVKVMLNSTANSSETEAASANRQRTKFVALNIVYSII